MSYAHRRGWAPWAWASVLVLCVAGPAGATMVGGAQSELLALTGDHHHLAIVADRDLAEQCSAGCPVFLVDTRASSFRRREVVTVSVPIGSEAPTLLDAYLTALGPERATPLRTHLLPVSELRRLQVAAPEEGDPTLAFSDPAGTVRLEQVWEGHSMAAYERSEGNACLESGQPRCPTACLPVVRDIDGERRETWECTSKVERCDCTAEGHAVALVLRQGDRRVRGRTVMVEPFRLWHLDAAHQDANVLELSTGVGPSVAVYVSPEGTLLAAGAATHFPSGNGTYHPVFAALPAKERGTR